VRYTLSLRSLLGPVIIAPSGCSATPLNLKREVAPTFAPRMCVLIMAASSVCVIGSGLCMLPAWGNGSLLYRAFSEPCQTKPTSGLKIQESWLSGQKFRATWAYIIPKLWCIVIKLDKLLWSIYIVVFENLRILFRCKMPYTAQTHDLRLVKGGWRWEKLCIEVQ